VREVAWVTGVKTGYTGAAGYVLVGSATRHGAQVVSVVLGAPSESARDADTLRLLRYGLGRYRRIRPVRAGTTLATAAVEHFSGRRVDLVAERPVAVTVRRGQRVRTEIRAPGELEGPLAAGAHVGSVTVYRDGRRVRSTAVVTASAVPEAGFVRKLWSLVWSPVLLLAALGLGAWIVVRRRRATSMRQRLARAQERAG
jgi:serine-type D-Ala-D-Ala carboxypeptidase (penicillin-binding protein 5/6)